MPLKPSPAAHLAMSSNLLKGFWSPANWARKIAGPFTVLIGDTHSFRIDSLWKSDPSRAAVGDGALDKGHAPHAFANAGDQLAQFGSWIAETGAHCVGKVTIDVGKCFEQPRGMAHGETEISAC